MIEDPDRDNGAHEPINWMSIVLGALAAAIITSIALFAYFAR